MSTNSIYRSPEGQAAVMAFYDRVFAQWPVPCDQIRLATRQGETFIIASGDPGAPPLVLLHGASSNALAWIADVPVFARCFRVYSVDVIGEPGRSAGSRPGFDGPAYVEWLDDVLAGLGITATGLVGLSQGGYLAARYATERPARVSRLALLAPGGMVLPSAGFMARVIVLTCLGRPGANALNRIIVGSEADPGALAFMEQIMTHIRPNLRGPRPLTDEALRRLTMPVLLVVGEKDAFVPGEKVAARLRALVPHLTARVLPDTGHVLHGLAEDLLPFLTD